MIFALGTPVSAKFKPWSIPGMLKPDGLMISVVDFLRPGRLLNFVRKKGIREVLNWNGLIVCDSGAFTAINSKKSINLTAEWVKEIYQELFSEDDNIIKISLDFPTENILENYKILHSVEVQPAVPHNRLDILKDVLKFKPDIDWIFVGRLVPLMRNGRNQLERLKTRLNAVKKTITEVRGRDHLPKLWTLGLGAPSLLSYLINNVDGTDSSRWRVSGSNMILLPNGGERGVGNRTKWVATHRRIQEGEEKLQVLHLLRELFSKCDDLLSFIPKLKNIEEIPRDWIQDGPHQVQKELSRLKFNQLFEKILSAESSAIHPLELEIVLRASNRLRLLFNYHAILKSKMEKERKSDDPFLGIDAESILISK